MLFRVWIIRSFQDLDTIGFRWYWMDIRRIIGCRVISGIWLVFEGLDNSFLLV
jgi:hypothetical protein